MRYDPHPLIHYEHGDGGEQIAEKVIWLPRLNQLLEMNGGMPESAAVGFNIRRADRRETYMLELTMEHLFGKKWNGDAWVRA